MLPLHSVLYCICIAEHLMQCWEGRDDKLLPIALKDASFTAASGFADPKGVPGTMCEVVDMIQNRGFEIGRAMGRAIGLNNMASLLNQLLVQNRIEDIKKAAADPEYRRQLMQEFAII